MPLSVFQSCKERIPCTTLSIQLREVFKGKPRESSFLAWADVWLGFPIALMSVAALM